MERGGLAVGRRGRWRQKKTEAEERGRGRGPCRHHLLSCCLQPSAFLSSSHTLPLPAPTPSYIIAVRICSLLLSHCPFILTSVSPQTQPSPFRSSAPFPQPLPHVSCQSMPHDRYLRLEVDSVSKDANDLQHLYPTRRSMLHRALSPRRVPPGDAEYHSGHADPCIQLSIQQVCLRRREARRGGREKVGYSEEAAYNSAGASREFLPGRGGPRCLAQCPACGRIARCS